MTRPVLRWAEVDPGFGSALPHGSCNAVVSDGEREVVCGYPRRADGSCLAGTHPRPDHRGRHDRGGRMSEHALKTIPPYFDAVWNGDKTFEVRKNDRGFQTGDALTLWEYDAATGCGRFPCASCRPRWVKARISYVFAGDPRWPALAPGYVVLGLAFTDTSRNSSPAPTTGEA